MAILKIKTEKVVYRFLNGKLIYKRWLETGQSLVFDVMAYTKNIQHFLVFKYFGTQSVTTFYSRSSP